MYLFSGSQELMLRQMALTFPSAQSTDFSGGNIREKTMSCV